MVAWTVNLAKTATAASLLDHPPQQWHQFSAGKHGMYQRFLLDARETIEALVDGDGWEANVTGTSGADQGRGARAARRRWR